MRVAVKRGQIFSAARKGKPRRYVKVVWVSLHRDKYGPHPVVSVREVSKNGKLKDKKSDPPVRVFLTYSKRRWVMPPGYEKVE